MYGIMKTAINPNSGSKTGTPKMVANAASPNVSFSSAPSPLVSSSRHSGTEPRGGGGNPASGSSQMYPEDLIFLDTSTGERFWHVNVGKANMGYQRRHKTAYEDAIFQHANDLRNEEQSALLLQSTGIWDDDIFDGELRVLREAREGKKKRWHSVGGGSRGADKTEVSGRKRDSSSEKEKNPTDNIEDVNHGKPVVGNKNFIKTLCVMLGKGFQLLFWKPIRLLTSCVVIVITTLYSSFIAIFTTLDCFFSFHIQYDKIPRSLLRNLSETYPYNRYGYIDLEKQLI
jgi:hypothetical protein